MMSNFELLDTNRALKNKVIIFAPLCAGDSSESVSFFCFLTLHTGGRGTLCIMHAISLNQAAAKNPVPRADREAGLSAVLKMLLSYCQVICGNKQK